MISLVLVLAAMASHQPALPIKVLEVPDESDRNLHLTVFIKAPHLKEKESNVFRVMAGTLLQGTEEYSRQDLMKFGGQAGSLPEVKLSRDYAQLEMTMPADGADLLFQLAESILVRASLSDEGVDVSKSHLIKEPPSLIQLSLEPYEWTPSVVAASDVKISFARFVRPENVVFVLGGKLKNGQAKKDLLERFSEWRPGPRPKAPRYEKELKPVTATESAVSIFEFSGRPLTPATPFSGVQILATFALGAGKDCTLWKVIREQHKWAYRTEAILWPTADGWIPRFFIFKKTSPEDEGFPNVAREAILKDVDAWDEDTLTRAKVCARASLTRDFGLSPLWLSPDGPKETTLRDRMSWRGYLEMIGSGALDEKVLADAMDEVDLLGLKVQGKKLIESANVSYIPGKE